MGGPYTIATIGSHSALQILKGAKDEGFKTLAICTPDAAATYRSFGVADEIVIIDSYDNFEKINDLLIEKNAIIIPHGSFISHLGIERTKALKGLYYGNKDILEWESDRTKEGEWLTQAGLKLPLIFEDPNQIDRPVIVKFYGARGGRGYFLANGPLDFKNKIAPHKDEKHLIQEYIVGVPLYAHYFYSPLTDELEIMSFDIRYESNVDSLGRITARDQLTLGNVDPSYVVVGNIPVVIRESLLHKFIEYGRKVIEVSKKICPTGGLIGPFCLEGVLTPETEFICFEISARIVAGTNPYIQGSPYTAVKYDVPMSTGRRIALDLKKAIEQNKLSELTQ